MLMAKLRLVPRNAKGNRHVHFDEYRSNDEANVMVYKQRRKVKHADYVVGMFYVAPSDLLPELFYIGKAKAKPHKKVPYGQGNYIRAVERCAAKQQKSKAERNRVIVPHDGDPAMKLYTRNGLLVATGYLRVEFGGRGPYLEFTESEMQKDNLHLVPAVLKKGVGYSREVRHHYFHEYRTNDPANVLVYLQRKTVKYANYKLGFWYVSPSDLFGEDGKCTIMSA